MTIDTLNWKSTLEAEKEKTYFKAILAFLEEESKKGKNIYPPSDQIFNALTVTPFEKVKVVIIGQDPYHGPKQAHGMCFSVLPGIAAPPSLQNIFKELHSDVGFKIPSHGYLKSWAEQGVLLLNTALTVVAGMPQSHSKIGWHTFTDRVIESLNQHPERIVFLLWGSHAQTKIPLIDIKKHAILKAPHPSPLSAYRGFIGCRHFSKANALLAEAGREPIDWTLPETVEVP